MAKNEIYARHKYIFKNEDLYNYFMGCVRYHHNL
ncbi:YARHG domain-containing protein [Eisenbergiella massiliensis]|uniref:YARHG domain-containing protein n=1 Tax=Eisenbergiella massiliensis TaxID=1720294 RepID=A0A3E3IN50_9FIRM|nr:YARHG domain-containing protein [Eisenbergiella massiliensis]